MTVRRVLVLAPHTDDAELGCGGTLARLLEEGAEVWVAVFSTARESLPSGAPPDLFRNECGEAMCRLGLPEGNLLVYDLPVRRFTEHRQDLLEELVHLRRQVDPDTVLLPSAHDVHQDHQVVAAEGLRAFKERTVWGYELPWNQISFTAQAFAVLARRHVEAKWHALSAHQSQIHLGRPYFQQDFVEGLARVRGTQVKAGYAEAFEVMRQRW